MQSDWNAGSASDDRRVAALAYELAVRMEWPHDRCVSLRELAQGMDGEGWDRRAGAIERIGKDLFADAEEVSAEAEAKDREFAKVIEVARAFDQAMQFRTFEERPVSAVMAEMADLAADGLMHSPAVKALRSMHTPAEFDKNSMAGRACPSIVMKLLPLLRNDNISFNKLEQLILSDQLITSSVLRVANSALFAPGTPITTIPRAVAAIGLDCVRKVILASSTGPLFASARLNNLWRHSLDVAEIAEQIAVESSRFDPSEAFVSGLIHDIGRLAIESLPAKILNTYHTIATEPGGIVLADLAIFGADHGELGARVMTEWGLPPTLIDAVRYHHTPDHDLEGMAPILYLAEFATETDEDPPSTPQLDSSLKAMGMRSVRDIYATLRKSKSLSGALAMAV